MNNKVQRPLIYRIIPDIAAFVIGLSIAYVLQWKTTDLVWSLWLCSLSLGYLTMFSAIAAGAYLGIRIIRQPEFEKKHILPALAIGTVAGIFFLGFFSIHFGGFHSGHAVFLGEFFPLAGVPTNDFGDGFMNPPKLIYLACRYLMPAYGLFIIPALIAERKHVFKALIEAVTLKEVKGDTKKVPGEGLGKAMGRPYVNVVRMHLLIFFFAFCHAVKIDSFLVYAVVYAVYFFPWREFKQYMPKKSEG